MNNYIPGWSEKSPRTQADQLIEFLNSELRQKNLLPGRIFAMADITRKNQVEFSKILNVMWKILPSINKDFFDQIPYVFEMRANDVISKEDFDLLFERKVQNGPKASALKLKNQRATRDQRSDEYTAIVKYFAECLNKENITPLRFFKKADKNFNQVLTVDELKDEVKISLPESFAGLNFKKLTKALDQNNNGTVE